MPGASRLTKDDIRSKILLKLKTQKEENRSKKSELIKRKLFKTRFFNKAKTVMFYVSFGGEVLTQEMIKESKKIGKTVVVPVCEKNRIKACLLQEKSGFVRGPYGIKEPAVKKPVGLKNIDLVVVPGVAFTKEGVRLGRGKGYYDRFLAKLPSGTASVGLAFDFQILPAIPSNKRDVAVNKVIFA